MENNFFVGNVVHKNKKGNNLYNEKIVLYTCDNVYFIDLLTDNTYTTNSENRDYVVYDSLVPTNSEEFRIDYDYLLIKHNDGNNNNKIKRKRFLFKK
mgnify:FL=1